MYSTEDMVSILRRYFDRYREFTGHPHPKISEEQLSKIVEIMPYFREVSPEIRKILGGKDPGPDILPEEYPEIIEQHFRTNYRNCDYNINHFFSGKIRELRLKEVRHNARKEFAEKRARG